MALALPVLAVGPVAASTVPGTARPSAPIATMVFQLFIRTSRGVVTRDWGRGFGCSPAWSPFLSCALKLLHLLELARVDDPEGERDHRHLEQPRAFGARLSELLAVPVPLEVELRAEYRDLREVERVVLRAPEGPERRPEVDRRLRGGTPRVLELVAAERIDVPEDRVDRLVRVHAPTSARIAPGPSAV